jgi:hypothetical protein
MQDDCKPPAPFFENFGGFICFFHQFFTIAGNEKVMPTG